MIHHLQENVEQIFVSFLYFVQYKHRIWCLTDCVRQKPALIETDIARRRSNQTRHGVLLHVLTHVKAQEIHAQNSSQLLCQLGLSDTSRSGKQKRTNRLSRIAQSGARQLDCLY